MRTLFCFFYATVCFVLGLTILSGSARAQTPAVQLSPTSLTFSNQEVGTSSLAQFVTLTNVGTAQLTITKILGGSGFAIFSSCPVTLAAGASCTFGVNFAPTMAGSNRGQIQIQDDASDSPQKIKCIGTGTTIPIALSPISLDFGTVAVGSTSNSQSSTLTNQSTQSLVINSVTTTGPYNLVSNTCVGTIAAGASCSVSVSFSPQSGATASGVVSISDSDTTSPQAIGLSGSGTSGTVSLSPTSLTFTSQKVGTTSATQPVTVTNGGSTTLSLVNIVASGDFTQTNTCGTSLSAGSSCQINVSFVPSSTGTRSGFITLNDTDPSNLQTVNLSGTGLKNAVGNISVSPRATSLTFTQTQTYQAFVGGVLTTNVTWSVDGITGGNSTVGTISTAGLYTPPATAGSHAIKAVNNDKPSSFATVFVQVTDFTGTFTYHNDNARTGQNLNERLLTTGNVNVSQFGKRFSYAVDAKIYAEPLYVASVNIPGQGVHNVVYVVTENDSVYAFDADTKLSAPLWFTNFTNPSQGITAVPGSDVEIGCESFQPTIGISGTPVIDPVAGTIYMVGRTKQTQGTVVSYHQYLYAVDITTGQQRAGSPVEIQASVPGFGEGSTIDGTLPFDPKWENSRVSLLLSNGVVYLAWASLCDTHPYHGWIMGYDATTLGQLAVFNTSPNGQAGGIWQSQAGMAADSAGSVYLLTTNGLFDVDGGGGSYGNVFLKLASGTLAVEDYFAPYNTQELTLVDFDLSSGGPLLLPDQLTGPPHLILGAGKEGTIYVLDRDNMGKFSTLNDSQIVQELFQAVGHPIGEFEPYFGAPAYFNNQVYFWGVDDGLKAFRFFNGLLSQSAVSTGSIVSSYPGPIPTISANGTAGGIVWSVQDNAPLTSGATVLRANDAANVSRELYNSMQVQRDRGGAVTKFMVPTVANGKVYVGTQTELDVYGLLP